LLKTILLAALLAAPALADCPASVNLLTWTEEIDASPWIVSGALTTANPDASPDCDESADHVYVFSDGAYVGVVSAVPALTGAAAFVNIPAPSIAWDRYEVTATFDSLDYTCSVHLKADEAYAPLRLAIDREGGTIRCLVRDVGYVSSWAIWGWQLEQASAATAYQRQLD
jgi:hypothetical protein